MRWLLFKNSTSEIFVREKRGTIILRGGKTDGTRVRSSAVGSDGEGEGEGEEKEEGEVVKRH